jgi:uncharacterized protein involved in exopolysaccharide biosynthesis
MIQNRELSMDDYMAMLRRRGKAILIPALIAPLIGFLVSYAFTPKYTSESTVLVEPQKVPDSMVQPVVAEDLTARVTSLQQQMMSQGNLQTLVEKVYPGKPPREVGEMIDDIRLNVNLKPVLSDLSQIGNLSGRPLKPGQSAVPAFKLEYTASKPSEAQRICSELTTVMLDENLKSISEAAKGTSDVLGKGLGDAKQKLDDLDATLAEFKKQHSGQLPGDEENNLKILAGLSSQLEANTQTLNRAQQDKAYAESMLAQQLTAWKSSQTSNNPQTLEKQLSDLQTTLMGLQARYTDDHPDVVKTKADIAEVKKKLAEVNKASSDAPDATDEKASALEPPEIRQMRLQIHQYADLITAATRDQKRYQEEIATYQGRVSLSPDVEKQYSELMRDSDNAHKNYQELLAKKSAADLTINMNDQSEGERMAILFPADLPDSPSFPNRLLFAAGGLGAGLALGCGIAMWLELRDNSIRTEADAEAALELPMLVSVPWVGLVATETGDNKFKFWSRKKTPDVRKDTVGV